MRQRSSGPQGTRGGGDRLWEDEGFHGALGTKIALFQRGRFCQSQVIPELPAPEEMEIRLGVMPAVSHISVNFPWRVRVGEGTQDNWISFGTVSFNQMKELLGQPSLCWRSGDKGRLERLRGSFRSSPSSCYSKCLACQSARLGVLLSEPQQFCP